MRGATCHSKMKHHAECRDWCDRGLELEADHEELLRMRQEAVTSLKAAERDERKRALEEKRRRVEEGLVLDMIRARGIRVAAAQGSSGLALADLEPCHPAAVQKRVHVTDNTLVWPVLFLYPEFGETDFIEEFSENDQFASHLETMFGAGVERPPWDPQNRLDIITGCLREVSCFHIRYTPSSIVMYFEDCDENLVLVSPDMTLCQALTHHKYLLKAGTPGFIILVTGSKVHGDFLQKYKVIK